VEYPGFEYLKQLTKKSFGSKEQPRRKKEIQQQYLIMVGTFLKILLCVGHFVLIFLLVCSGTLPCKTLWVKRKIIGKLMGTRQHSHHHQEQLLPHPDTVICETDVLKSHEPMMALFLNQREADAKAEVKKKR